ncbi:UDP-N-acetylmuramate:L-alanyl-gamma-D-glutamyl-meso-diaminopimelate ligase [Ferrimonas sp. SCSIO 43195]|uniref:UDP-N-acetylmuramate:L-alanyl-gamma-D-glutamyl- meso-diaminopimelate ligase n=1 Tax=Ferrimonas sp. SCSIO 43195 TaxID=2822844 RepID=UPI002075935A|nr:UDP-N-acetylmuramate:L-alanyl-gamma-D-glutamyl-meso-diaminopimelate ligase [Ferrimonas sp. SCSIO 43195]USD36991.1 UDP-N-acetylmuramate:L-alanyl-gamma-D-glutamyl-meso-diaminopimelate ligase [Ferrimonas sp. SCSIO 43195]
MHVHILGICGTFMGGIALLARSLGHTVTGSDANVFPPMSTQLEQQGIALIEGFDPAQLEPAPDLVVIGNAMSRGNPCVEAVLDKGLRYTSGPQFLAEQVLDQRWVLAVAGTHGKTTTASMLAWLLQDNGLAPGFLIGGVPREFGVSARLGETPFFVVEADEYDTAFFDKRSKFVHYHPRTLVMNNLEFDHADIFDSIADIQKQFHHLLRTVPGSGQVIWPESEPYLAEVIAKGCWSEQVLLGEGGWSARKLCDDGSAFEVCLDGEVQGTVRWSLIGDHNISNALAALAAARHVGVRPFDGIDSLSRFAGPKRRMELRGEAGGIQLFDDFAHHPTAIATSLKALQARKQQGRVLAVLEPRSNTMKAGVHQHTLAASLADADAAFVYQPATLSWDLAAAMATAPVPVSVAATLDELVTSVVAQARAGDTIVVMSNGGFGGIHGRLLDALEAAK